MAYDNPWIEYAADPHVRRNFRASNLRPSEPKIKILPRGHLGLWILVKTLLRRRKNLKSQLSYRILPLMNCL
ncbi:hypothetical protein AVEN_136021-1, partial [Araneus ventricosus]